MCEKDYGWNLRTCICENNRYLKGIADDWVIVCDEIKSVIDSISTNVTNAISANVTGTVSINSDDKKVRYQMNCYILDTFLLVTTIAIICYHYGKHRSKLKNVGILTI